MADILNVLTDKEVQTWWEDFSRAAIVVADTETNGLHPFHDNHLISISMHFPEFGTTYNLPLFHGEGAIQYQGHDVPVDPPATVSRMTWQGGRKKQLLKAWAWPAFKAQYDFQNMSAENAERVAAAIIKLAPKQTWIFFNASFDVHFLEDFCCYPLTFAAMEDVQTLAHLIFEDWGSALIKGTAAFKGKAGPGNGLKPLALFFNLPLARSGEAALEANAEVISQELSQFIWDGWDLNKDTLDRFHKQHKAAYSRPSVEEIMAWLPINEKSEMWMLPSSEVAYYASLDVILTWQLREHLLPKLEAWNQRDLYTELNAAHAEVLIRMERNGVLFDTEHAAKLVATLDTESAAITEYYEDGLGFNPNSPQQILAWLLTEHGIEWPKTDKEHMTKLMEYAVDEGLEKLQADLEPLLKLRHNNRAAGTYLKKWQQAVTRDGVLHPHFNQIGTVTGRWSSSGLAGNFQNVPKRGYTVAEALVAPEGWWLIQADYSNIEMRLAAWIAGCTRMIDAFTAGEDMHAFTRDNIGIVGIMFPGLVGDDLPELQQVCSVIGTVEAVHTVDQAWAEINDWARKLAKVCNFGLLYNGTHYLLGHLLGIPPEQAKPIWQAWHDFYPEYAQVNEDTAALALTRREAPGGSREKFQYITQPLSGRARKLTPYPTEKWVQVDKKVENRHTGAVTLSKVWEKLNPKEGVAKKAFNSQVQGLANYILQMGNLRVCREFSDTTYRPWAHIHDADLFYLKKGHEADLLVMKELFEDFDTNPRQVMQFGVSATGRWQHLHDIEDLEGWINDRD